MKSILSTVVLLAYPNHNLPFEIYSDVSDYQMDAVILQNGRPVAYWSRKLNSEKLHHHGERDVGYSNVFEGISIYAHGSQIDNFH